MARWSRWAIYGQWGHKELDTTEKLTHTYREGVEERDHLYTVSGNVNWCSHYGRVWRFLQKLKIELPHDPTIPLHGLSWWLSSKESTCNAGDAGSSPGSGRSPGEGNGNPLQCSCLENPMERGAWRATVHGVAKNWNTTWGLNNNYSWV